MGIDSKKRISKKIMGASPSIGWRSPRNQRNIHPSGMREILVSNLSDLEGASNVAVRIASAVGAKKKELIAQKAKSMGLAILNYGIKEMKKK